MKRPAGVMGRHRGLRTAHVLMRILLVGALVVLLTLIAMREVAGLAAAAAPGRAASTSSVAPSAGTASAATTPTPGGATAGAEGGGA